MRHTNSFFIAIAIAWILTALTSCTTISPPAAPSQTSWETRKTLLSRLQSWQINGKIAVVSAQDSGSASVDWSQRGQNYTISLFGPLGAGGIKLNGKPGHVTMTTSNGQKVSASSPEQLIAQEWGWHLPVSYLKFWIRGLPVPNMPQNSRFDTSHRLSSLTQQGFHIQYQGYTTAGVLDLPQRISISSSSFKTKIIIYQWHFI